MPTILIKLPHDRNKLGQLSLLADDGSILAGPYEAFGKADSGSAIANGNPTRSTVLRFGDTPTGTYTVPGLEATGDGTTRSSHSYGPNGAIRLNPISGDAATAAGLGRQYLLIHGGDPNSAGRLRPTNGCVRLGNASMLALLQAIAVEAHLTGPPDACTVQMPFVSVTDGGGDDGYNEGDPPPIAAPAPYPGSNPLP